MPLLITVTIAGGAHLGPQADQSILLNSRKIVTVEDTGPNDLGNSVITMEDKRRLYVTETRAAIMALANA